MEILSIMAVLTVFPFAATGVGLICVGVYFLKRAKLALITGVAWIVYSIYEYLMYARILCTGECNIRVDLLLIYPVLLLLLLAVVVSSVFSRTKSDGKT